MIKKQLINNAKKTEIFLKSYIKKQKKTYLLKAMKYGTLSGGKKIRSSVIINTGKLFNLNLEELNELEKLAPRISSYFKLYKKELGYRKEEKMREDEEKEHKDSFIVKESKKKDESKKSEEEKLEIKKELIQTSVTKWPCTEEKVECDENGVPTHELPEDLKDVKDDKEKSA